MSPRTKKIQWARFLFVQIRHSMTVLKLLPVREDINTKKNFSFEHCPKENVFLYWCLPLLTTMWFWLLCRSNFHSNNYIFVKASIPTCPMRWDFDCRLLIHASGWNKNYIQICSLLCSWVQQKIYYKFLPKSWKSNSSSAKITYNPPHRQGYLRIQEKERMRVNVKAHITIAGSKYACPST